MAFVDAKSNLGKKLQIQDFGVWGESGGGSGGPSLPSPPGGVPYFAKKILGVLDQPELFQVTFAFYLEFCLL